jgi:DNA invertase Pin-like site-specific DNA recombinase
MPSTQVIAYCRVSTQEQQEDRNSLIKQMQRVRLAGATKIYYDIESRTSDTRRGLLQLIEDINYSQKGEISKFIFIRIDRLTASYIVFYQLMDALKKKDIACVAVDENFNIDNIADKFTINVRLAAAQYEVEMLSKRVKDDVNFRKLQNKPHWNAPFGYQVIKDNYTLDHTEVICLLENKQVFTKASLARFIFDCFFEVGTINKTVAKLHKVFGIQVKATTKSKEKKPNIIQQEDELNYESIKDTSGTLLVGYSSKSLSWTVSGLRNTLINPVYAGGTPYDINTKSKGHKKPFEQWTISWGTHGNTADYPINSFGASGEAIITYQEYEQIKSLISTNRYNRWATEQRYLNPFAGLLKCYYCHAAYSRQSKKLVKSTNYLRHYYQCSFYRTRTCSNSSMISSDSLEQQVIVLLIQEAEKLSKIGEHSVVSIVDNKELQQLKIKLSTLESLPYDSDLQAIIMKTKRQIAELDKSTATQSVNYIVSKERIISAFSDPLYWESLDISLKSEILKSCIRRIYIKGNQVVSIDFKY